MPQKPPNPIDAYVGARIRMRRVELKISRASLGEAIGLTHQQIQKYENGTNRVGASRLQQICAMLQIPVAFVFEGGLDPSPRESSMPRDILDFLESEEGARLVAAFSRIRRRGMRQGIVRLASRIAEGMQPRAAGQLLQLKEPADST